MNKARLLELASIIEKIQHVDVGFKSNGVDDGFCMVTYTHDCGSPLV